MVVLLLLLFCVVVVAAVLFVVAATALLFVFRFLLDASDAGATAYTSAMMLQMLAQHSTHAKSALAIRAGDCVASIGQLAHAASDRSQEAN